MSKEFDISVEKLREEVNPVYNTAQSCLQIVASLGDAESEEMRKTLGFSVFGSDSKERAKNIPPQTLELLYKIMPALTASVEARFFSTNNFITATAAKQVLDLPCGYTARGVKFAKSGIRYCGADLPAVIDAMKPAAEKFIGGNENVSYHAVDATNYASLRRALESAEGELFITTEGMLMYLTQSELETVFANIRKLLLEFGGKWVTLDNELTKVNDKLIAAMTDGMSEQSATSIANIAAGAISKTTLTNNTFFCENREQVMKFVSDMGFDLEIVPIREYLPDMLRSFAGLPEDKRTKAMAVFDIVNFWVMTPKSGTVGNFACSEDNFKADVRLTGDTLSIALTGRLDTISAPGLLSIYREAGSKGSITSVSIDMKELDYISSAGLRVLMIMRKAVGSEKNFTLLNMNETVTEIIQTTGFDTIFC